MDDTLAQTHIPTLCWLASVYYVAEDNTELSDPHTSVSQMLGLQACGTMSGLQRLGIETSVL